ncbi:hypothetical protein J5X84_12560 [Streptosporangiaceae bacterium NEAU-GS5]|nr:hypothetical protein [Streptosporangiaceae bacterium NEAU-GS5]
MGPEIQYQMIISRVAELHEEASHERRARAAKAARKADERSSHRRARGAFGKFRSAV